MSAAAEPRTVSRPLAVEVWNWASGTYVEVQMDGEVRRSSSTELQSWGTTELGNGRAGSQCSRSSGVRNRFTGRQAHPVRIQTDSQTWEAQLWGTHVWDKAILVRNREPFRRDRRTVTRVSA